MKSSLNATYVNYLLLNFQGKGLKIQTYWLIEERQKKNPKKDGKMPQLKPPNIDSGSESN
jgi:hypothetical protein